MKYFKCFIGENLSQGAEFFLQHRFLYEDGGGRKTEVPDVPTGSEGEEGSNSDLIEEASAAVGGGAKDEVSEGDEKDESAVDDADEAPFFDSEDLFEDAGIRPSPAARSLDEIANIFLIKAARNKKKFLRRDWLDGIMRDTLRESHQEAMRKMTARYARLRESISAFSNLTTKHLIELETKRQITEKAQEQLQKKLERITALKRLRAEARRVSGFRPFERIRSSTGSAVEFVFGDQETRANKLGNRLQKLQERYRAEIEKWEQRASKATTKDEMKVGALQDVLGMDEATLTRATLEYRVWQKRSAFGSDGFPPYIILRQLIDRGCIQTKDEPQARTIINRWSREPNSAKIYEELYKLVQNSASSSPNKSNVLALLQMLARIEQKERQTKGVKKTVHRAIGNISSATEAKMVVESNRKTREEQERTSQKATEKITELTKFLYQHSINASENWILDMKISEYEEFQSMKVEHIERDVSGRLKTVTLKSKKKKNLNVIIRCDKKIIEIIAKSREEVPITALESLKNPQKKPH